MQAPIQDEFPSLCDTCLGPSKEIRMSKRINGGKCQICERLYTIFRWTPAGGRPKKTIICHTCAAVKNCCQTCLFDLHFHLPLQVRDSLMANTNSTINVPMSADGAAKLMNKIESQNHLTESISNMYDLPPSSLPTSITMNSNTLTTPTTSTSNNGNAQQLALLEKLNRRNPSNYDRNKAKVCTFWLRGACDRGDLCPFRHEDVHKNSALKHQTIKSRYYGTGDVLAEKILERVDKLTHHGTSKGPLPNPPDDTTIMTLFIDLNPIFSPKHNTIAAHNDTKLPTKDEITNAITIKFAPFGLIQIHVFIAPINHDNDTNHTFDKPKSSFATVTFQSRQQAENAILGVFSDFSLCGNSSVRLNWSLKKPLSIQNQISNHHQLLPPPPPPPPQ